MSSELTLCTLSWELWRRSPRTPHDTSPVADSSLLSLCLLPEPQHLPEPPLDGEIFFCWGRRLPSSSSSPWIHVASLTRGGSCFCQEETQSSTNRLGGAFDSSWKDILLIPYDNIEQFNSTCEKKLRIMKSDTTAFSFWKVYFLSRCACKHPPLHVAYIQ